MKACRGVQKAIRRKEPLTGERERHLFECEGCRGLARAERILGLLGELHEPEPGVSADFVERVMRGLPRGGRASSPVWPAVLRWAAAVILFAMAAGYGYRAASTASSEAEQVAGSSLGAEADAGLSSLGF